MSFRNNMNPGAGDQFYPYGEFAQYPQYPRGWIYPYILNDRGNVNHSPSASVTNAESLPESSPQFMENSSTPSSSSTSSRPTSSAESKKAQDRWSKEEEKLLVQLWAEKHYPVGESRIKENMGLDRREDIESARNQQDGQQMHTENEVYHRTI